MQIYFITLLASGGITLGLALSARHRAAFPGAIPYAVFMLAASWWSFLYAAQLASTSPGVHRWLGNLQYIGIAVVPPAWFLFTCMYTGRTWIARPRAVVLLFVPAALTILLALTSPYHDLLRSHTGLETTAGLTRALVEYGPAFWLHLAFCYAFLLGGSILLISWSFRDPSLYRGQTWTLVAGAIVPWVANFIYIFKLALPGLDLTPISFTILGLILFYGRSRFRLLEILPIARDTVVEGLNAAVVVLDLEDRVVDANPAASRLFLLPREDAVGLTRAELFDGLRMAPDSLEGSTVEYIRGTGADRQVLEVQTSPLQGRGGRRLGTVLTVHDITIRKRSEEELVRTHRLMAVGELSAGVSHNLNNMLTSVLGYADLAREDNRNPQVGRAIDRITRAGLRARDLVHRLSESARETVFEPLGPVDLNETVREAVASARPRWRDEAQARGVQIRVDADYGNVPLIRGARGDLHSLVLNLLLNAIDALPGGGEISIATRSDRDTVRLSVTDNGTGMSEEVRRRVFEPFFTTKMTVGTGLGLSTAYGAVKRWGGEITVTSELGRGSTFEVRIPACPADLAVAPSEPVSPAAAATAESVRILIADDDEDVADALARFAELTGHRAVCVPDGKQAMKEVDKDSYDVAMIDLSMPGASGDVVADRAKSRGEGIVTVLVTGWNLNEKDPRLKNFDLICKKPLDLQVFLTVMGRVLALRKRFGNPRG